MDRFIQSNEHFPRRMPGHLIVKKAMDKLTTDETFLF